MKHLPLKNTAYKELENRFANWLQTLGYAKSTEECSTSYLREFFFYLEENQIQAINHVHKQVIKNYFVYLSRRKHHKKHKALSTNTLRSHFNVLRRFGKYLRETGQGNMEVNLNIPVKRQTITTILSKREIKLLYEAAGQDILGIRDTAMLSVYYGCGLRRNEGVNLDITDILTDKNKILVREGKGYKERFVPITKAICNDLEYYLEYSRPFLIATNPMEQAFFVSIRSTRLSGNMLYERLQQLREKAGIIKDIGLHTLRHSIATHLLKDGMDIEMVSRFLGHSSLESTQIYTHLAYE